MEQQIQQQEDDTVILLYSTVADQQKQLVAIEVSLRCLSVQLGNLMEQIRSVEGEQRLIKGKLAHLPSRFKTKVMLVD